MKRVLFRSFMVPSVVVGAIIPLSAIAPTKTSNLDNKTLSETPDNISNSIPTDMDNSGKTRYIVIDDSLLPAQVISSKKEFLSDDDINTIRFTLSTPAWQMYSITGVEKIVMGGKDLVAGTDYEFNNGEVQLKDSETTKKGLYNIFVTPKMDAVEQNCTLEGRSKNRDGEWVDNVGIVDMKIYGKVTAAESFMISLRFNDSAWVDGWYCDSRMSNPIGIYVNGELLVKGTDYNCIVDSTSQNIDITVNAGVARGYVMVLPYVFKQGDPRPDPSETFDFNVYAEGTLLHTYTDVITYGDDEESKHPEFTLSIDQIDPDRARPFTVYDNSVKMTINNTEELVPYNFNSSTHVIKLDLSGFTTLGDIKLDIHIKLRSGHTLPSQTFRDDSWRELDTLEQFFGDNTEGFARAYGLKYLGQFANPDRKFKKSLWTWTNPNHKEYSEITCSVVSVNQMPLAGEPDPDAKDKNIVIPSEKKAYFTFMCDFCVCSPNVNSHSNDGFWFKSLTNQFENYLPNKDHDGNCWYRTNPPPHSGRSSDLRTFAHNKLSQKWFLPENNGNFAQYVKHIANRTVVVSAKPKETTSWPEKYIDDTFFIPTAVQLGFKRRTFADWGYIMESETNNDRVFKIYQNKNWDKGNGELKRLAYGYQGSYTDERPYKYWLATPASNNSGIAVEDVAFINNSGNINRADYDDCNISIVPCFCI